MSQTGRDRLRADEATRIPPIIFNSYSAVVAPLEGECSFLTLCVRVTLSNLKITPPHYYIGQRDHERSSHRGKRRILDCLQYVERWYGGFLRFSLPANGMADAGATL